MSGKFVRASKYRHVFGQATKKESCFENLKITKNAWDSNIIQCNGKYLSVNWDISGGGAFAVIPLNEVGKAPDTVSLFRGHKGPVLDTAFNPFDKQQIVSCSDDGKILVWKIPDDYSFHRYVDEEDNIKDITEPVKVLSGHTRKVGLVEFHPCAKDILVSSSLDYTVKVWNVATGENLITLQHKDLVTSFAFNYNGSLLATTSRDKQIRVWNIRSGEIISEGPGHNGAKPSRVCWLGNSDRIITTGFSRLSDRQIGIWDVNNISSGPIDGFFNVDASSGVLIPFFDSETSILYIAGKGDGNIRYYEYENDNLFELSQFSSTDPQRGVAMIPKHSVNVKENEITRVFKTVFDSIIEPVSFIVPRRSELFQGDIYPDCPSQVPALTGEEWFGGKEVNGPLLMSMEALYEGTEPEIHESAAKPEKKKEEPKEEIKEATPKLATSKVETPVESGRATPNQNVDELLKSSSEVNSLLNKVVDQSDDEDAGHEDKDEAWEEVAKEEIKEGPAKEESQEESKEVTKEEPKEIAKEESKIEVTQEVKEEPKIETKEATPVPVKEATPVLVKETTPVKESTPAPSKESSSTPAKPTLASTIEKLSNLVNTLETQVAKLTQAGLEKDERLSALESKIDQLLNKQ